jgi:hypothetical protein
MDIQKALYVYVAAFNDRHLFKAPEFFKTNYLKSFRDIYENDVGKVTNPIRESWWHFVTKDDIVKVTEDNALRTFLLNNLSNKED